MHIADEVVMSKLVELARTVGGCEAELSAAREDERERKELHQQLEIQTQRVEQLGVILTHPFMNKLRALALNPENVNATGSFYFATSGDLTWEELRSWLQST